MYILYLDESGNTDQNRHFVLGGLAVFERQHYFLHQSIRDVENRYLPGCPIPAKLRVNDIRGDSPAPPFDGLSKDSRLQLIRDVYAVLASSHRGVVCFAVALERRCLRSGEDAYSRALEELLQRFESFIRRLHYGGTDEKGLIIIDKSQEEQRLRELSRDFLLSGTRWGGVDNVVDVPYFGSAKDSKMLQLADFVTHAVFSRYEMGFTGNLDNILQKFDSDGGRIHGLSHICVAHSSCNCPACMSRRLAAQ